jgi:hypothetical protein
MTWKTSCLCALTAVALAAPAPAQDKAALQQRLGEVKASIAQDQAKLKQYAWTETTEVSLKGEVKKRSQNECSYGADGKVVKKPIGEAPAPGAGKKRGLKGKIVENKIDDMKEYMDRVGSLVRRYVPPSPQAMQAAFQAGKASLDASTGAIVFTDYAKQGDKVTLAFDPSTKKLRSFAVATYLDAPADTVTLDARFSSLSDGTNFLEESVLNAKAKEVGIKTTNSGHHKAGA